MSLAPIILFTFNRLEHTKKTIEALKENRLAKESDIYIFSDGARNEKEKQKVDNVRRYIKEITGFRRVTIIESKYNKGLARSVIDGVTQIINKYEKVIVLEDDIVTSSTFLEYMNSALDLYKERDDIWSISGYSPNIKIPFEYNDEVYITKRGSSWGWATWKNRWLKVDWQVKDYKEFKKDREEIKMFNLSGKDLFPMLDDQMNGRIDSWAVRWVYSQFKEDMWTVYPVKSVAINIGNDLSGTHSSITSIFNNNLYNGEVKLNIVVSENKEIVREFKNIYDKNFSGYLAAIIKKVGLYKIVRKYRNIISIKKQEIIEKV